MQFITLLALCQLCHIVLSAVKKCDNGLFHFDLRNNDLSKSDETFELTKLGEVSIRGRFKKSLSSNLQMLVWGEFQELYKVDQARVVSSSV